MRPGLLCALLAAPASAQFRTAPLRAPVLAPTLAAPAMVAPMLAAPLTLTPTLPAVLPPLAAPALPLPTLAPSVLPAARAAAAPAAVAQPAAQAFAAPLGAFAAVKEAAPQAERGEQAGSPTAAARMNTLFDGAGKLAGTLQAPAAKDAVDLSQVPTDVTPHVKGRKQAAGRLDEDLERIVRYQEQLFARGERAVLLVFQGMDTGGKDGAIKVVVGAMNPQGVRVTSFKKPTASEARHHYLWRIKKALPTPGGVGVLNRSQYEDILVPTVLETLPAEAIEGRYEEINSFEKALADKGVVILKFFLHISKAEQKRRLQDRLDNPEKNWKFSPSDLESRKRWDAYQAAYGKILARTNKPWAPWYIIPADNKWYRDYAVGRILRKTLQTLNLSYPPGPENPGSIVIPD